jgi:hypothetical protein
MNFRNVLLDLFFMPGIISHEFGHRIFCDIFGVRVQKVRYFSFTNPPGFVIHEHPKNFLQTFFITVGPLIFNTLLAVLFGIFSLQYHFAFAWLSISVAAQSFPSSGDAKSLWKETKNHMRRNFLAIVGFPISGLIQLINLIRSWWFDIIYGVAFYLVIFFL